MLGSSSSKTACGVSILAVAFICALILGPAAGDKAATGKAVFQQVTVAGQPDQFCEQDLRGCEALSVESAEEESCQAPLSDDRALKRKGPPPRTGFCRCSCGAPCKTSADCGGASCDRFITCC